MRRVVITGLGIVSSIGKNAAEVTESLREARSGVVAAPEYAELGFRSQVHAPPKIEDWAGLVDRRAARFLAPGTARACSKAMWAQAVPGARKRAARRSTRPAQSSIFGGA